MVPQSVTSKRSTDVMYGQNGVRPAKRVRLADDAYGSIATRQTSDLETSLEVDHMILDYLTFQAIETCFAHKNLPSNPNEPSLVDHAVLRVDEFFHLFKSRYPKYRPDVELRFRQHLLQLVTLFTQRLHRNTSTPSTSALKALRSKNHRRTHDWIGDISRLPTAEYDTTAFDTELALPEDELQLNRTHVLEKLGAAAKNEAYEDAFYGTKHCVSLLDLLPLFMRVSALCHGMWDSGLTPQWMRLAANWMLHACLEQYLVFGVAGSDAMDEAFAWGYEKREEDIHNGGESPKELGDDPFDSEYDDEKAEEWEHIRDQALAKLIPTEKHDGGRRKELVSHLVEVSLDFPVTDIESNIIGFLRDLARCIPKPTLAQLESGKLDGMSEGETQAFVQDCGLELSSMF